VEALLESLPVGDGGRAPTLIAMIATMAKITASKTEATVIRLAFGDEST
jgi:hypothetical protein